MILFQLNFLFILVIHQFGCFPEKFDFVDEIEKCQKLEKDRTQEEWQKIEPQGELEKCIIEFNIAEYLNEIKGKFKSYNDKLKNRQTIMPEAEEFQKLSGLSDKFKKLYLEKNLMELLETKLGYKITKSDEGKMMAQRDRNNKFIIPNKRHQRERGTQSEPIRIKWDNESEMEIKSKGRAHNGIGNSSRMHQMMPERNENHKQILKSLYDFRQNLNNEIKWLNMMIWLKIPKVEIENLIANLKAEKFTIENILESIIIKESMRINIYERIRENELEMKNKFNKQLDIITGKWNPIREKKTVEKMKRLRENLQIRGEFNIMERKYIIWPLYDNLLERIKMALNNASIVKVNLDGLKRSSKSFDTKEEEAVDILDEFIVNWNKAVDGAKIQIERHFVDVKAKEEYVKMWNYIAVNHATSLIFEELMEIFGWDEVEIRLAKMWLLVNEYLNPFLKTLSGNYQSLLRELKMRELIGGNEEEIQIKITNEALKMLNIYERMNKLHKIEQTNSCIKGEKLIELRKEIDDEFESNLPQKTLSKNIWEKYTEIEKEKRKMQPKVEEN